MKKISAILILIACFTLVFCGCARKLNEAGIAELKTGFRNPPESSHPGVYWYFMDGNISGTGMTADLEAMKKAGIGSVVFLEVNVGVPRGKVDFLSDEWQNLFAHAVHECERLGISTGNRSRLDRQRRTLGKAWRIHAALGFKFPESEWFTKSTDKTTSS